MKRRKLRKTPSWKEATKAAEMLYGWFTERIDKNTVVLERGRQRIVATRFRDGKWKIEYFSGRIMDDMSGITTPDLAKRELVEMAMRK